MAHGRPTQVISNMPNDRKPSCDICAFTTRFVLVPIIEQVPPNVAAKAIGMKSFDGLIRDFLQMSSTTGMNIATIGVLLRNALSVVTGSSNRS